MLIDDEVVPNDYQSAVITEQKKTNQTKQQFLIDCYASHTRFLNRTSDCKMVKLSICNACILGWVWASEQHDRQGQWNCCGWLYFKIIDSALPNRYNEEMQSGCLCNVIFFYHLATFDEPRQLRVPVAVVVVVVVFMLLFFRYFICFCFWFVWFGRFRFALIAVQAKHCFSPLISGFNIFGAMSFGQIGQEFDSISNGFLLKWMSWHFFSNQQSERNNVYVKRFH